MQKLKRPERESVKALRELLWTFIRRNRLAMQCVEQKTSSDGVRIFRAISRERVLEELNSWAAHQRTARPELLRIGLFGSYAKDSFATGSDIDVLILVKESAEPRWFMRSAAFDTTELPVGADLFIYTQAEAERMQKASSWFRHILQETVWIE